jgi:hypothetical protein
LGLRNFMTTLFSFKVEAGMTWTLAAGSWERTNMKSQYQLGPLCNKHHSCSNHAPTSQANDMIGSILAESSDYIPTTKHNMRYSLEICKPSASALLLCNMVHACFVWSMHVVCFSIVCHQCAYTCASSSLMML